MPFRSEPMSRRDALRAGLLAGVGLALAPVAGSGTDLAARALSHGVLPSGASLLDDLITRAIPKSGERIPVVGLGTNQYSVTEAADVATRRDVIRTMPEMGLTVIDTARGYGQAEVVIGGILQELGNRDRFFLATKCTAPQNSAEAGLTQLREAFDRLQVDRIDLMMVHNLNGTDVLFPLLREWKEEGRLRYYGVSTSSEGAYGRLAELIRTEPMDIIQVDYSLGNRGAAETILPLAQEHEMGVMLNVPFGGRRGGNLFSQVSDTPLPAWAAEIGAQTWAQYFLKYLVSHPAVTVAIPGTTQVRHLNDNAQAARGELPDAAMRRRMEEHWDSLG
jgi:aryl-alcohol dehydrogenase-like predicted oxidoreductase